MGLWIANFLARSDNDITIADIYEKTPEIAEEMGFFKGYVLKGDDLTPVLADDGYFDYHIAVIATTINNTPDVIRRVGPRLRPGSLLMDITSIKGPAMKAMDEAAGSEVMLSISEMGHFLNRTLWHDQAALTSSLRPRL